MKNRNKEKRLLNIIKFGVLGIIIVLSILISSVFIQQKKSEINAEILLIEENYMSHNKSTVENLVNKIHKFIEVEKEIEIEELKTEVKEQVKQAHLIALSIYNKNVARENYSKEKTINEIKETLRTIRYNNDFAYIFIYELNGKSILNSEFPNLEGKNLWNFKDASGKFIIQDMNRILKEKDETYYEWYWKKSKDDDSIDKKIGFFKKFEPYGLFIGSGDYIYEYEKYVQNKILKKLNSIEFKAPEHIFVYDSKGICLSNPKKELIGKNRYNSQNKEGRYVLREILKYAQENKQGFVRYKGSVILNKNNITNDKVSYVKQFEPWGWVVGSGFYMEELYSLLDKKRAELEKSSDEAIKKIALISLFFVLLMIFVSFYISKRIDSIFYEYRQRVDSEMKNAYEKEKLLIQQSKMATMGEMIGNIAHQWKQPLNLMSMSNSLVKLNQEDKDFSTKEEINEAIDNIDVSIKHLSTTIDDFRNFFKPDKEKREFDLKISFEKTHKLISSQFKNNDIQLLEDIESIKVFGFPNELLQVLINIIKNAKDELIKLEKGKKRVLFIQTKVENNYAYVTIKDNAGGIPKNIMPRIFEAYFTTKKDDEGTGIGLYMSKQIIEGMDGKIEASNQSFEFESEEYKGAQFIIKLPLA
ncbi:sensor histidine kinase [Arcobacter roscoffensis]|uniref:histidine kinase n=1 Tax=Arcobacter roscoffensis TaxID=2961520 RepID=A0ABY5E6F5_9BACT|nr:cache domain-containing protein [Arcobacter roscoffensis]UTJ07212.1 cache domain-containing protein [Arcobacter roscoffensis]